MSLFPKKVEYPFKFQISVNNCHWRVNKINFFCNIIYGLNCNVRMSDPHQFLYFLVKEKDRQSDDSDVSWHGLFVLIKIAKSHS